MSDFELNLSPTNRWVKLSMILPWDDIVIPYMEKLSADRGAPSVDARIVLGSLYIKHRLGFSDRETIATIQENPYMQYFLGLNVFHPEPLFDPSLFVEIRKRMGFNEFDKINKRIIRLATGEEGENEQNLKKKNKGKLKVDATVCDQYIKYPTDLDLLNQSRQWSEKIIDEIFPETFIETKPRTYRRIARACYLKVAKKKKKTEKEIRKAIKQQLCYLKRNLEHIDKLLDMFEQGHFPLSRKSQQYLLRIHEVYRQQKYMYDNKTHQCVDRIVSLHQPHVRPIVRGKEKTKVEFGSKINLSLAGGFARIDRLSWDAFNECGDLKDQVGAYKNIFGYYPELIQADKIFFTRENRKYLDDHHIRYTASPLGRPSNEKESSYIKRKHKKEKAERNQIEGKFGQGKNGYELNRIRAKLKPTSESMIGCIVFVMNIIELVAKHGG